MYLIVDDQIGGRGIRYDLLNDTARSPVSVNGRRIRFALPQPIERALSITVEFEGGKLTATGKDRFVDSWDNLVPLVGIQA